MTSIESKISDMEVTITAIGLICGISNLWAPQFGWADDNMEAGENPFQPQYLAALQIFAWMFGEANKTWVHLAAEMQAGKTGVINALIRLIFITANFRKIQIAPQGVFIVTGMNDNSWKRQTKDRMPKDIHQNIHHLKSLRSVAIALDRKAQSMDGFKNILVVVDESHIASGSTNTPSREIFVKMRLLAGGIENWAANNIRMITISATDPALIISVSEHPEMAKVVNLRTGDEYQSVEKLRAADRIHNTFNLTKEEHVSALVDIVRDKYSHTPNLYHIIRLPSRSKNGMVAESLRKFYPGCSVREWDSVSNARAAEEASSSGSSVVNDINEYLEVEPDVPTFILIKNMFYAAKTLDDTYCGILFDRSSAKDDTNCQSLLGRACGYNKSIRTHIYTNEQTVRRYIEVWNRIKPTDTMVIPNSDPKSFSRKMAGIVATTHVEGVRIAIDPRRAIPLGGINLPEACGGLAQRVQADEDNFDSEWTEWFESEDECINWWRDHGGRPQRLKANPDGFLICSAQKTGILDVVDINKLRDGKKTANSAKTPGKMAIGEVALRRYGAYIDVNDNKTARFCVHLIKRIA
jgi:hypothetical protein